VDIVSNPREKSWKMYFLEKNITREDVKKISKSKTETFNDVYVYIYT